MIATIELIQTPLFPTPDKWAIIFHTNAGREEFGTYVTKAAAKLDAKAYDITITK